MSAACPNRLTESTVKRMNEYFIVANSLAAPMVSDESKHYVEGRTPQSAMNKFLKAYRHWVGIYSANLYNNADEYHKGESATLHFRSNKAVLDNELQDETISWKAVKFGPNKGVVGVLSPPLTED